MLCIPYIYIRKKMYICTRKRINNIIKQWQRLFLSSMTRVG